MIVALAGTRRRLPARATSGPSLDDGFERRDAETGEGADQGVDDLADIYLGAIQRRTLAAPLDPAIATLAAELRAPFHIPSVDSLIYAHAVQLRCPLVTSDQHLQHLPGVEYHATPGASGHTPKARRAARRPEPVTARSGRPPQAARRVELSATSRAAGSDGGGAGLLRASLLAPEDARARRRQVGATSPEVLRDVPRRSGERPARARRPKQPASPPLQKAPETLFPPRRWRSCATQTGPQAGVCVRPARDSSAHEAGRRGAQSAGGQERRSRAASLLLSIRRSLLIAPIRC